MSRFGGLPEYVDEIKEEGIKFVTILDPCISTGQGDDYRPYALGNEVRKPLAGSCTMYFVFCGEAVSKVLRRPVRGSCSCCGRGRGTGCLSPSSILNFT